MPSEISGVNADCPTVLRTILKKWIHINREVVKDWQVVQDAPWWYNERASLSILAGAIWRSGGISFEEFSEEKLHASRHGARLKAYSGRCDLFFQIGRKGFIAEAKQAWSGGTTDHDPTIRIQRSLSAACEAADQLAFNEQQRLAIVFVTPSFKGSFKREADKMIRRWMKKVREIPGWEKAWVFPLTCRMLKSSSGKYYPGAAVLVRKMPRRRHET